MEVASKRRPKASIIIITWNQRRFLEKSLPMIFDQIFKDFEAIAVDSGSTDGALELMRKYPIKIVHYKGSTGSGFNYARAFNLGAKEARGEFLVRLSGDAIPANKFWLVNLLKPFSDPKVAGSYSRQLYSFSADWDQRLLGFFVFSRFHSFFEKTACGLMFWGASCALRRDLWQKVPFDEIQKRMEDACWSLKVNRLGYKTVYVPFSIVKHTHKRSFLKTGRLFLSTLKSISVLYFKALAWTLWGK